MCIYYIYMYIDTVNHTERPSLLLSLLMCSSLSTSQLPLKCMAKKRFSCTVKSFGIVPQSHDFEVAYLWGYRISVANRGDIEECVKQMSKSI